jgi:hypothetical protein
MGLVWYSIPSLIVSGLAKSVEHLVWSFVWCVVAFSAISLCQAFIGKSLMEVDCSVDGFSPTLDRCLRVNHYTTSLFGDGMEHSLSDSVLVVRGSRARFICCTAGSEPRVEGVVIVLSSAIIASEWFDLIALAHDINSGLKGLVGGGASFRLLVRKNRNKCEGRIIVNE